MQFQSLKVFKLASSIAILFLFSLSSIVNAQKADPFQGSRKVLISAEVYRNLKGQGKLNPEANYVISHPVKSGVLSPAKAKNSASRSDTLTSPSCGYVSTIGFQDPWGGDVYFDDSPPAGEFSVPIPFDFCFYGTTYNSFIINNNGNITFDASYTTFTSNAFPNATIPAMIAPFWGDVDTGSPANPLGQVRYDVYSDYAVVSWDSVAVFNQQANLRNSFQLIISNGTSPVLPAGTNIAFIYGEMQWTTGEASGGSNGFGGTPATVGVNRGDGVDYIQLGRFDAEGTNYDGPFGENDQVSFLDEKVFFFNSCIQSGIQANFAPIAIGAPICDTITVCVGSDYSLDFSFIPVEPGQSVSAELITSAVLGLSVLPITPSTQCNVVGTFTGSQSNLGYQTVTFTATDDGIPAYNQAIYGVQPSLTRIEGWGNGGNFVDLTEQSVNEILEEPFWIRNPVYNRNAGPVNIKVIDPLSVPEGNFEFRVNTLDTLADSAWTMRFLDAEVGQLSEYVSNNSISSSVEEVISEWGLSVNFQQVDKPGSNPLSGNGFINATQEFADNSSQWLSFLTDQEGCSNAANWIRSGTFEDTGTVADFTCNDVFGLDERSIYEKVLGGTWAPFMLVSRYNDGPAYNTSVTTQIQGNLKRISSIDIVFTPDTSKWTRCPVFETGDDVNFAEGNAIKGNLRAAPSLDKIGNPDGDGTGMSWFPGYAINVETGERLNIGFGESSSLIQDNGRDMIFNPSSRTSILSNGEILNVLGGKHFIYVFNHSGSAINDMPRYDKGEFIRTKLSDPTAANKRAVYKDAAWVSVPLGVDNQEFLSNELKIKIRVNRPYTQFYNASDSTETAVNGNLPLYSFNTADLINVVPIPYYSASNTIDITFNVIEPGNLGISFNLSDSFFCTNETPVFLSEGLPLGGIYSGPGVLPDGSFDPSVAGAGYHLISYTYTNASGCSETKTDILLVEICSGLNEQLTSNAVRLFPNPVFDNTTLTVQGIQANSDVSICVIDGSGREIQQHIISSTNKEKSFEFNVEDLAEGIYSVIVKSEKNTSALRFIKL